MTCARHGRGWLTARGECYVCWAEREITRLRQGLWDVAAAAGVDTDGDTTPDHMTHPDIVKWALDAVRELRDDYNNALADLPWELG